MKQVDTLFDSFNGRAYHSPDGKQLRCAVKEDSPHHKYWAEAVDIVKSWTYKRLNKNGSVRTTKPPSQIGWMISLNAIQEIWKTMKSKGVSVLRPRSLNQDPLENLFMSIRYGCGCSDNPNVKQFIGSLKTQILNGLTNQAVTNSNCESDDNELLCNLKSFLKVSPDEEEKSEVPVTNRGQVLNEKVLEDLSSDIFNDVSTGNVNTLSVAYVAGFIIKTIAKHVNCELCNSLLISSDFELHNIFISNKEWVDSRNSLIYPSIMFTSIVGSGVTILEEYLNKFAFQKKLMKRAEEFLRDRLDFGWLICSNHSDAIIILTIKGICKIAIPWWCKRQNAEIKQTKKEKRSSKRKIAKFQHL